MNAPLTGQRYVDDIVVGDDFEQWQRPTRERVMAFMNVIGMFDPDPRITDTGTARAAGLEGPVVPSAMTFNLITHMVTDWVGPTVASSASMSCTAARSCKTTCCDASRR